ncbi:MAG TPA: BPSL0067 family protein [Xanthobacteraceae bacterium]|nr:BPSL0067 family protein [Xanthobacteraceae bacterium]
MFTVPNPHLHRGKVVDNGHCVRLAQVHGNAPHTSHWRRGSKVRGGNVVPGTVIATFSPAGRYQNRTDGASHAAVFVAEEPAGLRVWDQWRGQPVHQRTIRFRGGQGRASNDGDAFHVVVT